MNNDLISTIDLMAKTLSIITPKNILAFNLGD